MSSGIVKSTGVSHVLRSPVCFWCPVRWSLQVTLVERVTAGITEGMVDQGMVEQGMVDGGITHGWGRAQN